MMSAQRVSKKALYIALAATHAAGLCLQSAPLQRALSTDFNVRSTGARNMLQTLELEFDSSLAPLEVSKRSDRLLHSHTHSHHSTRRPSDMVPKTGTPSRCLYQDKRIQKVRERKESDTGSPQRAQRSIHGTTSGPSTLSLDDQLKLFPEGQARVRMPGDSPWHKECQHTLWWVPLHPPDPYELQPV